MDKKEAITGCILGTAVGDALGLPLENISKRRQLKMFPGLDRFHFILDRGMISDDTEHTCIVAQSLIASAGDAGIFKKKLVWGLRFWILGLPAGIGFATLRSLIKLLIGFPAHMSGVFSAGNGPAMRSPVIGVCFGDQPEKMKELVKINTRITHTDPKAEYGALAVTLAAYMNSVAEDTISPADFFTELKTLLPDEATEFFELIQKTVDSVEKGNSTEQYVAEIGLEKGVGGYVYHTVPAVIHSWLTHQKDYKSAITEIIRLGGDTDSTAAILGGIVGAGAGKKGIPEYYINGLFEWPRSVKWMTAVAERLYDVCNTGTSGTPVFLNAPGVLLRNLFFIIIVLLHVVRRLLPPY